MKKSMFGSLPTITVLLLVSISSTSSLFAQDEVLIFSVMGDIPYEPEEELILQQQIDEHNIYSPSEFMVHVGDMKGTDRDCFEISYTKAANYLLNLDVPTFVIPGDNEWMDCDDPDQGWLFWSQSFMNFETNFCGPPVAEKQAVRPENFAFVSKGVLVIGLNMIGGTSKGKDPDGWDARLQDNADWVDQQFQEKGSQVRAAVVFGHAIRSNDELFETQFEVLVRNFAKPVIYIQGENHSFNHKARFLTDNMQKVTVDKGAFALPLQVTVNLDPTNPFVINREPWNETSPMLNNGPCGSSANLTANPSSHDFGQTLVDSSSSTTIQITNDGDEDYSIADIRLEGVDAAEFNFESNPGALILTPLQVVDVVVSFNPTSFGQKSTNLIVEGGDPISPALTVPLTGQGHIEIEPGTTPVNYLLAFIADQGDTPDTRDVLQLIKDEGAQAVVHGGDFDYDNDAAGWEALLNQYLGPDIPVFATLGEDEVSKWHDAGGYQERLAARMTPLGITWDGDLGVQSSFTYNGIFFIQTAEGVTGSGHDAYLREKLAGTNAIWRISTFHKNMEKLQLCGHSDRTGWEVYEESRKGGAIITNAQCHVYARTHLLSNIENQTVVSTSDTLLLSADDPATPEDEGRTFDVISGLGGKSRHSQVSDGDWWAATFAKDDPSEYGALFGLFNYNGNPSLAKFYFKTVSGTILDTFYVLSPLSNQNLLTINKDGEGSVDLTPGGGLYEDNELVTLQANPAGGWVFDGWGEDLTGSDNPTSMTMDSNKNVTARFNLVAPLVASFTPASGQVGEEVTIIGLNFTNPTVLFNSTEATVVTVDSDTTIRAIVPDGATSGRIRVTNALGSGESSADFNVVLPPTLTSFTPDIGPPGTEVMILGSSFAGITEVAFNGTVATVFNLDSDTQLRAEVPGGAKTGPLSVTNAAGTATSALDFQVTAPPTTLSLIPIEDSRVRSSRPTNNYGQETFLQVRKSSAYHIPYLKFDVNGIFGVVQSAKLRLEVTDGGSDGGAIYLVSNNYEGTSEPWTEDGLIWDNAPAATGTPFSSLGAVAVGETVELDVTGAITGNGIFSFAIKNETDTTIKYSSKEGSTPPELIIEVLTTPFPVIASFTPTAGVVGDTVTLAGSNFTGTSNVSFGGVAAISSVISDSELHAIVPAEGSGKIRVTNADGTGESDQDFVLISPPTITEFSPAGGAVDDTVMVTGTHFTTVTDATLNSTAATIVSIDSDSQLRIIVPSGASTGKLGVTNPGGTAASTDDFDVTQPPVLAGFSPATGPIGTEVTVTGANCLGATSVMFGGTPADTFAVDSATELRAWVPNGANSGKISVTSPDGTGESAELFTVINPPTLSDFAPTSGPSGTEVTLTGTSFTGSDIFFNGIHATTVTIESDTQILAQVPAGASSGSIRATNSAGSTTSVSDFTVTAPPSTISVIAFEDTRVRSSEPANNYGSDTYMQVRKSSAYHIAYLKFDISGIFGSVQSAKLRLEVTDGGSDGGSIYVVSNNYQASSEPWTEEGLIWDNAPPIETGALSSVGEVVVGEFAEWDVTSAISGNGTFSFAIRNDNSSRIRYSSKEGSTAPELIIDALTTPIPVITSFNPAADTVGATVTLTGVNFTGTTDVSFGGTAASFSFMSDGELHADVPVGATTAKISVTNADGTGDSADDFVVISPPTITGFSPISGAVNDEVTVTGAHFSTVSEVSFGATVAPNVSIDSDNQLRVDVPPGASTAKLSVTNAGGAATSVDDFAVIQPPVIAGFSPSGGPVGTEVTVTGANCLGATSVMFGGTLADTFAVDSATELRAWVPNDANSGKISVTSPDGTGESAELFVVVNPPTLSDFTPTSGPPGTEVTLTGTSFTGSDVFFNGIQATTITIESDTQILAQVPAGASSGSIEITNSAGSTPSSTDFTVTAPPSTISVIAFEDTRVRSSAPTNNYGDATYMQVRKSSAYHIAYLKFDITGIFGLVQSAKLRLEVTDGGSDGGSIYVVSNNYQASSEPWTEEGLIWDNAPPIETGALSSVGDVVVGEIAEWDVTAAISGNGTYSFAIRNDNSSRIKYSSKEGSTAPLLIIDALTTPVPAITSFSPAADTVGATVTLAGVNFTGTTDVSFGGAAASFSFVSDGELHADVPVGATTGKIGVTNADGTGVSADDFVVISPPTVSGFSPVSGAVNDEVTVTGAHFSTVSEVSFGATVAPNVSIDSDNQLRVDVPSGASSAKLSVTNAGGTATSVDDFTVIQPPVIAGFSPSGGPVGTEVTVTGANCLGATAVMFGGTPADTFMVDSATELRSWVPNGANTGKIGVTNADGSGESSTAFTVIDPPTLTNFSPTSGPTNTEVTLIGANFSGSAVFFNGIQATVVTINSDTQISAQVPAGATSGPIRVSNAAGDGLSSSDFEVTAPPAIAIFTPIHDTYARSDDPSVNYGDRSTIHVKEASSSFRRGYLKFDITGLLGAVQSARIRLVVDDEGSEGGSIYGVSNDYEDGSGPWTEGGLTWNNAPVISGTPLSSVGGPVAVDDTMEFDVTAAITGDGIYSFGIQGDAEDRMKYISKDGSQAPELEIEILTTPIPVISSFTPNEGVTGTTVTLAGVNFTGTTAVTIGGTGASFTFMSDVELHVDVPGTATTGQISVTNADGTGASAGSFTVVQPPTLIGFDPSNGPPGTEVTLAGSGFLGTNQVTFNAAVSSSFSVISDGEIRAIVPTDATSGAIGTSNMAGGATSTGSFDVTIPAASTSFLPIQDTYAKSDRDNSIYGDADDLRIKESSSSVMHAYLKFDVNGLVGAVINATIFLKVTSGSDDGGAIYSVSNNYLGSSDPWDESSLNWNTAPEIAGAPLSSVGDVHVDEVIPFDVTEAIAGDGIYSFGINSTSSDAAKYHSLQSSFPPELVVETGPPSAPKSNPAVPKIAAPPAPSISVDLPDELAITSIRPNPFNIETIIEYALPEESKVSLIVYNIVGQQVRTLVRDRVPAGRHRNRWDGRDDQGLVVGTGVYIIRLQAGARHFIQRLTLLK